MDELGKSYNEFMSSFTKGDAYFIPEEGVDSVLHAKYLKYALDLAKKGEKLDLALDSKELFNENTNIERLRYLLTLIASDSSVESYRYIERYLKICPPELRSWALMARNENYVNMKSALSDEQLTIILSALGGKDNRLRYFVALNNFDLSINFKDYQKKLIISEFKFLLERQNMTLEYIDVGDNIARIKILVPLEIDVFELVREVIRNINEFGNFLDNNFFITNMKILDEDEIRKNITRRRENTK